MCGVSASAPPRARLRVRAPRVLLPALIVGPLVACHTSECSAAVVRSRAIRTPPTSTRPTARAPKVTSTASSPSRTEVNTHPVGPRSRHRGSHLAIDPRLGCRARSSTAWCGHGRINSRPPARTATRRAAVAGPDRSPPRHALTHTKICPRSSHGRRLPKARGPVDRWRNSSRFRDG
jgi:hypothetical protein